MTKVLIVEDEMPSARKLRNFILDIEPHFEVVDILDSVVGTIEYLKQNKVDLIFLDIHLSDGNSFDIFEEVKVETPIIFTTAFNQYAIEAFKQVSVDYLLKPLDKELLKNALIKYKKYHSPQNENQIDYKQIVSLLDQNSEKPKYKERFIVHYRDKIKTIHINEIGSFYAENKAVYMVTFNGDLYDINFTLEQLEQRLNPNTYFRANRKCLINIDNILDAVVYSKTKLKLNTKTNVPFDIIISTEKSPKFKQWLGQ